MEAQSNLLIVFGVLVVGFLIFDLGYLNRKAHRVSFREALYQSLFWIFLAIGFAFLILQFISRESAADFMSAYVTEKMLSVDNLFIIMLIFKSLRLNDLYYHKVLFWGILGAVVFRAIFIGAGALIVDRFHWILYIFGAFLIYTGFKFFFKKEEHHVEVQDNIVIRIAKKFLRFTSNPHEGKFFVRENGKLYATVLFMALLMVETTDIIFAVDSIPAVFAISQDPFVVFTSNIFAIMGLRALFFLIEGIVHRFHYLHEGLSAILVFIGGKMLADFFHIHISSLASFGIVMGIMIISLVLSVIFPQKPSDPNTPSAPMSA